MHGMELSTAPLKRKLVKRKVNKVKPIYDTFLQRLSEYNQTELSKFLRALYDSYVGRIEVENEVEALSIFERTNARGLDLEISDLLKNYLFSKKIEGIEDRWGQIVDNSEGTMLRMLKYFYVSKHGYILKPQLYKKLKSYATDKGPKQFTEELSLFSKFYSTVKAPDKLLTKAFFEENDFPEIYEHEYRYEKINRALEGLREFAVVQFCPAANAAYECLVRNKGKTNSGDAKKLIQLFETFEKYHFVNNVICERVGNEIEKLYADACVTYSKATNFVKATDGLINELKYKLATEEEFVANFITLAYAPDQTSLLCYIFDRFNNFGKDPAQCTLIYNPDPRLKRRNHNIEHFWPQNLEAPWRKSNKDGLDPADNIGNLLPLYFKDNSSLGKADPMDKIKRLNGDLSGKIENLTYVTEFIREYGSEVSSWDPDKIMNRAKKMGLKAYREIWSIN